MFTSYCVGPSGRAPNRSRTGQAGCRHRRADCAQTGCQDIGAGLGDLELLGPQIEVLAASVDRSPGRASGRRAVPRPLPLGQLERAVEQRPRRRKWLRLATPDRSWAAPGTCRPGMVIDVGTRGAAVSDPTENHIVAPRLHAEGHPARRPATCPRASSANLVSS